MAKSKGIVRAGTDFANSGELDLLGVDESTFEKVNLTNTTNTLVTLAAQYIDTIIGEMDAKDVSSSGRLQDSIEPTDISINGSIYSIYITAPDHLSYQDEGVDGWAKSRGSKFKFKKETGISPDMIKGLKDWLSREGSSARNVKVGISSRERRGMRIQDAETKRAVTAAYMIKRQGIPGKQFLQGATNKMELIIANQLGEAFKADIILNLT